MTSPMQNDEYFTVWVVIGDTRHRLAIDQRFADATVFVTSSFLTAGVPLISALFRCQRIIVFFQKVESPGYVFVADTVSLASVNLTW